MKRQKNKPKKKGIMLVSVLLLTVLLVMLTVSMIFVSSQHLNLYGNVSAKASALNAAEAGVEFAIAKLNQNTEWGKVGGDSEGERLEGQLDSDTSYVITFDSNENFYSYNNLVGKAPVSRTSPDGETPAYTAEIISKGTYKNTTKYLRVILVRDDIQSYPVSSDGKIVLGSMTEIDIEGKGEGSPGHIHSNWSDPDFDGTGDPEYSIIGDMLTDINSNNGFASSVGFINLPDTFVNVFGGHLKEGSMNEGSSNIDISKIIDKNKDSAKAVDPRILKITRLYWMRNDTNGMVKIVNTKKANVSGESYQSDLGISHVTAGQVQAALGMYAWDVEVEAQPFSNITYTDAEGVNPDMRGYPDGEETRDVGWDEIRGSEGLVNEEYTYSYNTPVWNPDENKWDVIRYCNVPQERVLETLIPTTVPTNYALDPNNWGSYKPEYAVYQYTSDCAGVGVFYGDTMTDFVTPEKSEVKLGMTMTITGDYERPYSPPSLPYLTAQEGLPGEIIPDAPDGAPPPPTSGDPDMYMATAAAEFGFGMVMPAMAAGPRPPSHLDIELSLSDDIYVSSSGPKSDSYTDYTKSLSDISNEVKSGLRDDVLKLEVDNKALRDGYDEMAALDTTMDLNGHSIYSDSHLLIGTEVTGNGSLISSKKLSYLTGSGNPDIACLSQDDLVVEYTGEVDKYSINGVLYTNDDLSIQPSSGIHDRLNGTGEKMVHKMKLGETYTAGSDSLVFNSASKDYVPVFAMSDWEGTSYFIPEGTNLTVNGKTFNLENYQIVWGTYGTLIYAKSGNHWYQVDVSEVSGLTQGDLESIGAVFSATFLSNKADVEFNGTIAAKNLYNDSDDINGNNSVNVLAFPASMMKIKYSNNSQDTLLDAMGSDFFVRKICWSELR